MFKNFSQNSTVVQFLKYNTIGLLNTFVGFGIVFTLMYLGFSATKSNTIGYAFGAMLSYYLNSRYTFKHGHTLKQALLFFMVLGIAYGLNYATLTYLLQFLNPYLAQLMAAVVYTLSSFMLAKLIVFKD